MYSNAYENKKKNYLNQKAGSNEVTELRLSKPDDITEFFNSLNKNSELYPNLRILECLF